MWLGIFIAGALIVWTVGGLTSLDLLPKNISKHFDEPEERVAWIVRGLAGLLTVVGIVNYSVIENGILHDFSTEMIGIGIGVWGIDELNRWRSDREYKRSIIRQMRSQSNDFALDAARIAEEEKWLQDGSFVRAYLRGARLSTAGLAGAKLGQADLAGANLRWANLAGADLSEANLTGAELVYANLAGADLLRANLERADLKKANLTGADLEQANLAGADLSEANLTGADLVYANLAGAELSEANLARADLSEANLTGALYSDEKERTGRKKISILFSSTRWPEGFDPKAKGAVNYDELSDEEWEDWRAKYRPGPR